MSERGSPREVRDFASAASPGSRAIWNGPLVLLVPLALGVCAVWWMRDPGVSLVPTRPPARVDPDTPQDVLGAELSLDGATLVLWLSPSDPDATRQALQTMELRKRYGFATGEPWRLRMEWRPAEGAAASSSQSRIALAKLAIEDDQGRALAPFQSDRELDPLATLLRPPAQPLAVGTSIDLILWGRAPTSQARLVGFDSKLDDLGHLGLESSFDIALSSRPLRKGDLVGPLARLDPPPAPNPKPQGKSEPSSASAKSVRGSDGARY